MALPKHNKMEDEVKLWLSNAGMGIYANRFDRANITSFEQFEKLNDSQLKEIGIIDDEHRLLLQKLIENKRRKSGVVLQGGDKLEASTDLDAKLPRRKPGWKNMFKRKSKLETGLDITMPAEDRACVIRSVEAGKISEEDAVKQFSCHEKTSLETHSKDADEEDRTLFRMRAHTLQKSATERMRILKRVRDKQISIEEGDKLLQELEDQLRTQLFTIRSNSSQKNDEYTSKAKNTPKAVAGNSIGGKDGIVNVFDAISDNVQSLTHAKRVKGQQKRPPTRTQLRANRQRAQKLTVKPEDSVPNKVARPLRTKLASSAAQSISNNSTASAPIQYTQETEIDQETEELLLLNWLSDLECDEYLPTFVRLGFDDVAYVKHYLDNEDLDSLCISNTEHRLRLLRAVVEPRPPAGPIQTGPFPSVLPPPTKGSNEPKAAMMPPSRPPKTVGGSNEEGIRSDNDASVSGVKPPARPPKTIGVSNEESIKSDSDASVSGVKPPARPPKTVGVSNEESIKSDSDASVSGVKPPARPPKTVGVSNEESIKSDSDASVSGVKPPARPPKTVGVSNEESSALRSTSPSVLLKPTDYNTNCTGDSNNELSQKIRPPLVKPKAKPVPAPPAPKPKPRTRQAD